MLSPKSTPRPSASSSAQASDTAISVAGGPPNSALSQRNFATSLTISTPYPSTDCALTVAVVEAVEELAARSAGSRLKTPLVGVLDEAANVCRWRDLPNLYSHYGSLGIILMTTLQSWSQGVEVWGESGMKKLWSASNIRVYGGGGTTHDGSFLEDLVRVIGDYDRLTSSTSYGRGQRTVSQQLHRERILDVDDLAAMPRGRAVVLSSGNRPTLIRTQPWMADPHADAVRASILAHDPEAEKELSVIESALSTKGAS